MNRSTVPRKAMAVLSAIAMMQAGVPGILSARTNSTNDAPVQEQIASPVRDFASMRAQLALMKASKFPPLVARAQRLELFVDIASTTDSAEQSRKIRRLRADRLRLGASPNTRPQSTVQQLLSRSLTKVASLKEAAGIASGPFVGNGSECYLEEEEPCSTVQEEADYEIFLDESEAETTAAQQDYEDEYWEYESFCNNYPEECGGGVEGQVMSGPSAWRPGCASAANQAAGEVFASIVAIAAGKGKLTDARLQNKPLSTSSRVASYAAIAGGLFVVGYWVGFFVACSLDTRMAPDAMVVEYNPFELTGLYRLP